MSRSFLYCFQWLEVSGGCSFLWYWRNSQSSMLNFFFITEIAVYSDIYTYSNEFYTYEKI
jgi:hypothetical protein